MSYSGPPIAAPRIRARVLRVFDAHEVGTVSAADVARTLFVSQSHLRRLLQRDGISLRRLRDEHLTARAVEALHQGVPITVLALRLGFSDPRAFRRAFKRASSMNVSDGRTYRMVDATVQGSRSCWMAARSTPRS
ncbi:helix-turn-helix domain-containing protein [Rhodococcus opacus]|uniref:helix-turn-helix domain-containing protein n=1 Tax=Rhodococcus opacus TaxID=37919 RepID=UPI000FFB6828|nr:helix-turn-helix domain-containing protein [Rhodococcus opacus]